ncbi:MAG: hypothetical protein G01um101470_193, partial [Parcubacteria group bacterium Gr01-1014_70]
MIGFMSVKQKKPILKILTASVLFFVVTTNVFAFTVPDFITPLRNGSSRFEKRAGADIRSAISRFLNFSFGDSLGTKQTISPEDALRIRQQNDITTQAALPFSSDDISELNVNAPSLFKEQTQFRKDIFLQGDLSAQGRHIELGGGTLSASNVLYGLVAGEGIVLSGNLQRPTISSTQELWELANNILTPRTANLTVSLGGDLQLAGELQLSSSLRFNNNAILYVPSNNANAFLVATSTESKPLFSLNSEGTGAVSFGATSSRAYLTVAGDTDQH